ncbi:hypothetical protein BaRGS_00037582 [Batillaria attramentaria]|uniref:Uncharacterized protein n=1 Tax=Batillaria attramentaria TaxID=370345 RepID=A0ABD0J8A4_9CAEN
MDKNLSISIALLFVAVAIATVAAFGEAENPDTQFGGDYYDRKFQNWLFKRGLGSSNYAGFGSPLGEDGRFFNWRDFLTAAGGDGISKRQLNYGPGRFGNFRRYFTNGLQDWRSTYTGMKKREATHEAQPSA